MSAATLSEIKNGRDVDIFGLVKDYAQEAPLLSHIEIMRVPGVEFKPPYVNTSLAPTYRAAYSGKDYADSGLAADTVELKYVDFSVYADAQLAESYVGGPEAYMAIQQDRALAGAMREIQAQFLMGVANNNTSGSYGFDDYFPCSSGTYSIDGGVTTGSACTNVYALYAPECKLLIGRDGELGMDEMRRTTVNDASGKPFEAYVVAGGVWAGAAFIGKHAGRRLVNIAASSVRDSHLADLIDKFGDGFKPTVFAMNHHAVSGVRLGRTATNPTGAPAPFPDECFGIPIAVCNVRNDLTPVSVS